MYSLAVWALSLVCLVQRVAGQTFDPFRPHSIPMAVRSPFLNVWLPSTNDQGAGNLTARWTSFWLGADHQWAGLILVDGSPYVWMGNMSSPNLPAAQQTAVTITSTQSIFSLTAGPVDIVATFLSPIEGEDLVKTSWPFSYLSVALESNDGKAHNCSVYTDISASWLVGAASEENRTASTTASLNGTVAMHTAQLVDQEDFIQSSSMILQGDLIYAALAPPGLEANQTYQSGQDSVLRGLFVGGSALGNKADTDVRALDDRPLVLAIAQTLEAPASGSQNVLFGVGHARTPTIQFLEVNRSSFFYSSYDTAQDAFIDFLYDYTNASDRAQALDSRIASQATSLVNADYAGLLALSLRQAFGAQELTVGGNATFGYNTSDIMLFQEEIGSTGYTNTVDVIFPTMPAFLYVAPRLLQYAIEPALYLQAQGLYPFPFAMHDLGPAYPVASGYPNVNATDEKLPLEESGNMIIMALAAAQALDDISQLSRYSPILNQWAQYLIGNGLFPADQLSTDDFMGPIANQTNLAIKAIIGIEAMANVSRLLGNMSAAQNYSSVVQSWLPQFYKYANASAGTHLLLNYGNESSWQSMYNLYADRLLGLDIFPESLYALQDTFYLTVNLTYGLPLDSRANDTKTDWALFTAAIATSNTTRNMIIEGVVDYVKNTADPLFDPLADYYSTTQGIEEQFLDRPVVGGHFSLLTMQQRNRTFFFSSDAASA